MKPRVITIAFLFLAGTLFADPALVPLPQQMQVQAGTFTLCPPKLILGAPSPAPTKILVDGAAARETAEYLAVLLFKSTGYRFEIATNSGVTPVPNAILLTTNSAITNLGAEGYELTVATNSVVIRAPASGGLFYGVQSLLQLLPPEILSLRPVSGVPWISPCVYIQDKPRFPWRGWMLDSVRHFFNKDEVKKFLDSMALHKLNTFHWHLDDDSGWRIEILKWPLLTQVGAWRTNILFGLNPRSTTEYDDQGRYGGFYTQADIREIVEYAAQRHIMIVPEIEMPGHSSAPLAAYPQFSCNSTNNNCPSCFNGPYSLNVTSYSGGVFCAARPETKEFLHDVLTEVIGLFPGPYIHIGGDEVRYHNWTNHPLDLALISSLGFTNSPGITAVQKYQSYFTQQIANWIKDHGKTMIGWSEIMNGGLVTNAVVMDWLATKATLAATNGQYAVMSPSATCYINKWENGSASGTGVIWSNEPPAQSGLVTLSTAYNYEPVPAGLSSAYTNYILGSQGNSWTEWIPSLQNMEFRMYPRLSALAEGNWTAASLRNFSDFTNRLVIHKQRLTAMGVNFNNSTVPPEIGTWTAAQISTNYLPLSWDITASVTNAGEIDVSFCWKSGTNGLDIVWAVLLENGIEIDRDTHAGFTFSGTTPVRPAYILRLPARRPNATYTLQAVVAGRNGTDCNGIVYRTNWD